MLTQRLEEVKLLFKTIYQITFSKLSLSVTTLNILFVGIFNEYFSNIFQENAAKKISKYLSRVARSHLLRSLYHVSHTIL